MLFLESGVSGVERCWYRGLIFLYVDEFLFSNVNCGVVVWLKSMYRKMVISYGYCWI